MRNLSSLGTGTQGAGGAGSIVHQPTTGKKVSAHSKLCKTIPASFRSEIFFKAAKGSSRVRSTSPNYMNASVSSTRVTKLRWRCSFSLREENAVRDIRLQPSHNRTYSSLLITKQIFVEERQPQWSVASFFTGLQSVFALLPLVIYPNILH